MQQPIVGILLAGGKSSRFGSLKMFAEHNGKAFYHHSLDAITPFVKHVYMVTQPHYVDQIKSAEADVSIMIDLPSVKEKGACRDVFRYAGKSKYMVFGHPYRCPIYDRSYDSFDRKGNPAWISGNYSIL